MRPSNRSVGTCRRAGHSEHLTVFETSNLPFSTQHRDDSTSPTRKIRLYTDIIYQCYLFVPIIDDSYIGAAGWTEDRQLELLESLRTFESLSLVHSSLLPISQEKIFSCVVLQSNNHLRRFCGALAHSSHLVEYVKQITIAYSPPGYMLGQVLPSLSVIPFPNLHEIGFVSLGGSTKSPFHHSLPAYIRHLDTVSTLVLRDFQFCHQTELRHLLKGFPNISEVKLIDVKYAEDRLGDFRPVGHRGLVRKSSCIEVSGKASSTLALSFWVSWPSAYPTLAPNLGCIFAPHLGGSVSWQQSKWGYDPSSGRCKSSHFLLVSSGH